MTRYYDTAGFGMGTLIEQRVATCGAFEAGRVFGRVNKALRRLEQRLSLFLPHSDIARLNACGDGRTVRLSPDAIAVLRAAGEVCARSDGAFDITAAPLAAVWRAAIRARALPGGRQVQSLLPLVCGARLRLDASGRKVRLGAGQSADLGGIGKGFAADAAMRVCREAGVASAFINLGGNVHTLGRKTDGAPWMVGVQDPRAPRGKWLGALALDGQSAVTSGDYEQYFEVGGRRYHHIVDPRTGFPADSGLMSATVVCASSAQADALSTAAFVLGLRSGRALLASFPGAEGVFVTCDRRVWVTRGLKSRFFADSGGYRFDFWD